MKKILMSLLILSAAATTKAQDYKTPFSTKEFSASAIKSVESTTSGGNISVSGTATGQATVEIYIQPGNSRKNLSKDEIQKKLNEDYDLRVEMEGSKLVAIAKPKKRNMNWNDALSISFKITVAKATNTVLTTSGGNVSLNNLNGTQDFTTSGGNLNIDQVGGKLKGRTSGGNINVKNASDYLDLTTSGGNIDAESCNGEIKLSTSGGNVSLNQLKGNIDATTSGGNVKGGSISGELEAHTSGGSVRLDGLACSLSASTSGGSIDIAIVEPVKFVKLSNSGGNIALSLPAGKGYDLRLSGSKIKTENFANFKGDIEEDEIDGTINGGGVAVTVRASSGRVSVSMK